MHHLPDNQKYSDTRENVTSKAATDDGGKCIICLSSLVGSSVVTLQCTHKFHADCVAKLQKFGVKQCCPLCRTPLPAGPDVNIFEEASRRIIMVELLAERGYVRWGALPPSTQLDFD